MKITLFTMALFWISVSYSQSNTPTGVGALNSVTGGVDHTATGYRSLYLINDGYENSAHGALSLYFSNGPSYRNAAYGYKSMESDNWRGFENTGVGRGSVWANSIGNGNTGLGMDALNGNATGNYNTAAGHSAGAFIDYGNSNTSIGALAGNSWDSESCYIGFGAESNTAGVYVYSTGIGSGTSITGSYMIRFGNPNVTSIAGIQPWSPPSDKRIKKNIRENVPGLAFINQLKPVTYQLNAKAYNDLIPSPQLKDRNGTVIPIPESLLEPGKAKEQIVYTGFIAQDVELAAQKIGYDFSGVEKPRNEKDIYGLRYAEFTAPLVKAVQELHTKQEEMDKDLRILDAKIKSALRELDAADLPRLEQNIPNPASGTTVIRYHVPATAKSAQLILTTQKGQRLKAYTIPGPGDGQITVQTSLFASGTYLYSLVVGGKNVGTKQMIVVK
jgi:hypothetical protein